MELQVKYVFIFHSIMAFVFGLGFLFAPDMIFDVIGYSKLGVGPYMGQIFGATILVLGIQTALIRNQPHSGFRL